MTALQSWTIIKLRPDGAPATTYQATGIESPPNWIAARAEWTFRSVDIGHFTFEPGDTIDEYFSLDRWYNLFAVNRPTGELIGWYCNVTYPTIVIDNELRWHDLWVDVIVDGAGQVFVLDEDEMEESGIAATDPSLYATILAARDELIALYRANGYPFSLYGETTR